MNRTVCSEKNEISIFFVKIGPGRSNLNGDNNGVLFKMEIRRASGNRYCPRGPTGAIGRFSTRD
jgi:hypothetical protein